MIAMFWSAVSWLIGSRVGRWLVMGSIAAIALWVAIRSIRASGRDEEAARQMRQRVERLTDAMRTIDAMGRAQSRAPTARDDVIDRLRNGDA